MDCQIINSFFESVCFFYYGIMLDIFTVVGSNPLRWEKSLF